MSTTIVKDREARTAEFSRLYYLFEHLATRGRHAPLESTVGTPPVSGELAPVLADLATLLAARAQSATGRNAIFARPRRNNVAGPDSISTEEAATKFPLAEQYPFTFKLMIHKLYALEEWADKVKEVVEASKMQFKPLAERDLNVSDGETLSTGWVSGKRGATPLARARSHSVIALGKVMVGGPRSPKLQKDESDLRVVKKRCVGRRKSVSGPIAGGTGTTGGQWIYDAAVSSVEIDRPRGEVEVDVPQEKLSHHPRLRRQSLARLEGSRAHAVARQRREHAPVESSGSLLEDDMQEDSKDGKLLALRREGSERGDKAVVLCDKRPAGVADAFGGSEEVRRMKKRPLSV